MTLKIETQWSQESDSSVADPERHEKFAQLAINTANTVAPWLLPLLDAANAKVFTTLGAFCFVVDEYPDAFDIPELAKLLTIEPWVAEGETAH